MNKKHKVLLFGLIKVIKYAALGIYAVYTGSNSSAVTPSSIPMESFGLHFDSSCNDLDLTANRTATRAILAVHGEV